jgi:hypothetical protein
MSKEPHPNEDDKLFGDNIYQNDIVQICYQCGGMIYRSSGDLKWHNAMTNTIHSCVRTAEMRRSREMMYPHEQKIQETTTNGNQEETIHQIKTSNPFT